MPLSVFYFPAVLIALLTVASHKAEVNRQKRLDRALDSLARTIASAVDPRVAAYWASRPTAKESPFPWWMVAAYRLVRYIVIAVLWTLALGFALIVKLPTIARALSEVVGAACSQLRRSAIDGYRALPEWAQPITWGLAAGTPFSIALVIFMVARK